MLRQSHAPLGNLVAITGQRATTDMRNGMRTIGVMVRIRATVTVSVGPVTAIRNRGSVLSLVDAIGIDENGVDRTLMNGRLAGFVGRVNQIVETPSAVRMTSLAVGATDLDETVFIPFASSWQVDPTETAFVERDPRLALRLFLTWNPTAANLVTIGGATVVISAPTIEVEQVYDDERQTKRPLYVPYYREQVLQVANAGVQPYLYLRTNRHIRALAIMQDTNVGEVSDIVTSVVLRGDSRDIISPPGASIQRIARLAEAFQLARALNDPGYAYLNFAHGGRLSHILSPVNDSNIRFEFTAAPSAAAGATSSQIRVGILELERVGGLTSDQLPFVA